MCGVSISSLDLCIQWSCAHPHRARKFLFKICYTSAHNCDDTAIINKKGDVYYFFFPSFSDLCDRIFVYVSVLRILFRLPYVIVENLWSTDNAQCLSMKLLMMSGMLGCGSDESRRSSIDLPINYGSRRLLQIHTALTYKVFSSTIWQ
jgi:hypothetical protein